MHIVITGGHTGMGLALSQRLLSEGHTIGLIVRSESRKKETLGIFPEGSPVEVFVADLAKRAQIESVAQEISTKFDQLDGLFNNAGVLLDKLYFSDYGNELQLEVNAISPYLLTQALKPLFDKAENPVVVNTATAGLDGKKSYDIAAFKKPQKFVKLMGSYMDSKLMLVLMMDYLSHLEPWNNIKILSVNPGAIKTKMTAGKGMPFWLKPIRNLLFQSPEQGASRLYEAAFDLQFPSSGLYISHNKARALKCKITKEDIEELLQVDLPS